MTETLGNIGDFIGGFGVVVTVIYLAYQIRQNTLSTRVASHHSVVADISKWTLQIGLNPEATRIYRDGLVDLEKMSTEEQLQFSMLMGSLVRHYENIHFQHRSGAIDQGVWDGWSSRIRGNFRYAGARQWWVSQKSAFSAEFQAFIDGISAEDPITPISGFGSADRGE